MEVEQEETAAGYNDLLSLLMNGQCEVCCGRVAVVVQDTIYTLPIVTDAEGTKWPTIVQDGQPHLFCQSHRRPPKSTIDQKLRDHEDVQVIDR